MSPPNLRCSTICFTLTELVEKYRIFPVIFRYYDCFYLWISHSLINFDSQLLLLRVIIDVFYSNKKKTKQVIGECCQTAEVLTLRTCVRFTCSCSWVFLSPKNLHAKRHRQKSFKKKLGTYLEENRGVSRSGKKSC